MSPSDRQLSDRNTLRSVQAIGSSALSLPGTAGETFLGHCGGYRNKEGEEVNKVGHTCN